MSLERSKPPHPTHGPDGPNGESWADYFKRLKSASRRDVVDDEDDESEPAEEIAVVVPAAALPDPLKAPGKPGTIARRVAEQGWAVTVETARVQVPDVLYASDSKEDAKKSYQKGDVRTPAHGKEFFILSAVKRAGKAALALEATWARKEGGSMTFTGATTFDPYLGEQWRPSSTKPRPQRSWEIEEDVAAPIGFEQWLDIIAPKPALKKKEAGSDGK